MTQAEIAGASGVTQKVVFTAMRRLGISARRAIKREQHGPANSTWRGEEAGYDALHARVYRAKGFPSKCENCGESDPLRRYEWANQTGNYLDIEDYKRMCVP
jgi:hypothetical protein